MARPTETVFGVQSRYDDINIGLSDTTHRLFLSNISFDSVKEGNVGHQRPEHNALDRFHSFTIDDSDLSCLLLSTIAWIFPPKAQREAVRRYIVSHHGEQIAEFVEVESGKRNDRPQLAAARSKPADTS